MHRIDHERNWRDSDDDEENTSIVTSRENQNTTSEESRENIFDDSFSIPSQYQGTEFDDMRRNKSSSDVDLLFVEPSQHKRTREASSSSDLGGSLKEFCEKLGTSRKRSSEVQNLSSSDDDSIDDFPLDSRLAVQNSKKIKGKGRPIGSLNKSKRRQIVDTSTIRESSEFEYVEAEFNDREEGGRERGQRGQGGRGGRERGGRGRGGRGRGGRGRRRDQHGQDESDTTSNVAGVPESMISVISF